MADLSRFRTLSPKEKALVAIGVLLDGHDATELLSSDKERLTALCKAAKDLAELSPELRIQLAGTLLRKALEDLEI